MPAEEKIPKIVLRNKDIEHIMLASAVFGVHGRGERNVGKLCTFLALADVHQSVRQMESAIDYLNYYDCFDFGVCLGDMQAGSYSDSDGRWYQSAVARANKPFFTVLGNHDGGNYGYFTESGTPEKTFRKFILPNAEKMGLSGLSHAYYTKRFDDYKIQLIALTNYDYPDTQDENGEYAVDRSYEVYSQRQIDFLIETLAAVPEDYHLLLCAHSHPYKKVVEPCAFSQMREYGTNNPYGNDNMVADIIHAWIYGDALKKDYAPEILSAYLPTVSVNCDFSNRGKGNFICHLVGHYHCDFIGYNDKHREQRIVSLAAAANDAYQNYGADLPRAEGTKAEDLLTAISIHTEKRQIRLVRIGSNFTVDMTERTHYILNY